MLEGIKGVYFDFGYVIGYPKPNIDRKNLYLNWDGIQDIIDNKELSKYLKAGVGPKELEYFFTKEVYDTFISHETTDLIDPKSYNLLLERLNTIFNYQVNEEFIDNILTHINTMSYMEIYPNASDVLEELKRKGYCLSMISNMMLPGKLLINKLAENDILHYFNTVTISSDIGFIKPRKEIYLKTLEKDGLKPEEVLFVGDTYLQDIIGAKSVGMKTVWLNCRQESISNTEASDFEISTLSELCKMI